MMDEKETIKDEEKIIKEHNRVEFKNYLMPFGKYRGIRIREVIRKHPRYFAWLESRNFGAFNEILRKVKEIYINENGVES